MAEIGLASSIIAVIQIVAAATTQAYNYGVKFKNAKEDIEGIERELGHVGEVLEKLKALAERAEQSEKSLDNWPALIGLTGDEGPLSRCNQALMDLMVELTPSSGIREKLSQRAKWAWRREKIEKTLQMIVKQKMAFLELLNMDQMSKTFDMGHAINEMSETQIKAKRNEIIRWLSPTDPNTNQEAARKKHEAQTGKWFTESPEYAAWLERPNSFLWLYGIPGCGKTILCSEIIEETAAYCNTRYNHYLAYFFFSFREPEKQKAANLPRSILVQLLRQTATIPQMIQAFHDERQYGEPPERGVMDAIQALLTGPHVFIIIDGLDECPNTDEERAELCNILKEIHSWSHERLHLLVTSRREADLTEALLPIVTQQPVGVQGSVVDADIGKFVRTQLRTHPKLSKWSPQIQLEIEETLVTKAHGMFRWVDCQFHSLSKCIRASDIRTALSVLPRTLDETYERILINIPVEYRPNAISALQWIVYSRERLSPNQIADAIVINPEADPPFSLADRLPDPLWISEVLPGLISIVPGYFDKYDVVEIAHFSVVDYLESARIIDGPARIFHLDKSDANIYILKRCFDILKAYTHPANRELVANDHGKYLRSSFSSLDIYACCYWDEHVDALKPPIEAKLRNLVLDFTLNIKPMLEIHCRNFSRSFWANINVGEASDRLASAFYIAALWGRVNHVKILLNAGADVNIRGMYGTALQAAARGGASREMLQALLEAGADVNIHGGMYGTALQAAAASGYYSIVKMLLDTGAGVNLTGGKFGSALRAARMKGNKDIVELLLSAGAKDDLKIPSKWS